MDTMMIIATVMKKEVAKGNKVTLKGKDIISTFNNVRSHHILDLLTEANLSKERYYCREVLDPRSFAIAWDREGRGRVSMTDGTPRSSPLSPILWALYIARTIKRANIRCGGLQPPTPTPPRREYVRGTQPPALVTSRFT